jgi:putative heme-binding domain-containing protein
LVTALTQAGGGSLALKIRQGDAAAIREALAALANEKTPSGKRVEYATLFGEVRTSESLEVMLDRLIATADDAVRIAILTSLPAYADERIPTIVLEQYPKWIDDVRQVAQSLLVSRAAWGLAFLNAVDAGRIDPRTIPVETVRLLTIHTNPAIGMLITKHWGSIEGASTAAMQAELARLTTLLDGAEGDPYPGKKLYMHTCGKCHTLHAQGGQVGPDLTTFKRDDVPRLLLNILNPSAEIREGFETHLVQLDDGRVVQGFLIEQDPQLLVLRGSDGQTTTIDRGGIEEHRILKQSLMPEGQLKTFTDEDVRNLFAYLRSAQPLND